MADHERWDDAIEVLWGVGIPAAAVLCVVVLAFAVFVGQAHAAVIMENGDTGTTVHSVGDVQGDFCDDGATVDGNYVCYLWLDFLWHPTDGQGNNDRTVDYLEFYASIDRAGVTFKDVSLLDDNLGAATVATLTCSAMPNGNSTPGLVHCDFDSPYVMEYGHIYSITPRFFDSVQGDKFYYQSSATYCNANADGACLARAFTNRLDQCGANHRCSTFIEVGATDEEEGAGGPTVVWQAWDDQATGSVLQFLAYGWRASSSVPFVWQGPHNVSFDLGIYRNAVLVYATSTVAANYDTGGNWGLFDLTAYHYSTTGTYALLVRATQGATSGPWETVNYTITEGGDYTSQPCQGGFFSACWWSNLLATLFIPSPDSLGSNTLDALGTQMREKAPFAYATQIGEAIAGLTPTSSPGYVLHVPIQTGYVTTSMDVPIMPPSGPLRTAWDGTMRPILVFFVYGTLVAYTITRFRGFDDNL